MGGEFLFDSRWVQRFSSSQVKSLVLIPIQPVTHPMGNNGVSPGVKGVGIWT